MDTSVICPRFETAISPAQPTLDRFDYLSIIIWTTTLQPFNRDIGISGRLLSERLKNLEAQGLVSRTVYPETPVRIEYALTEKGASLKPVMDEIQNWSQVWIDPKEITKT